MPDEKKVETKLDTTAPPVVQFGELTARVAANFAIEPMELWKSLKAEFFPGGAASDAQMFIVLQIMDRYKLNPFMREMFAAVSQKTGKLLVGVQYDGYMTIAHRHPRYKGFQFEYEKDKDGKVSAITCKVYRDDWEHPGEYRAEMAEWRLKGKDTWDQRPTHQLGAKAFNNAVRLTLGLSGIYDPDDIERIQDSERPAIETTATKVSEGVSAENSPSADSAAAAQQAPTTSAPTAATPAEPEKKLSLAERRKQKAAQASPTTNAGVAQPEEQGTRNAQVDDSTPSASPTSDNVPRAHLDKLIERHVTAARLNLMLGQFGVTKVEELNDEQVATLTARIEQRAAKGN